MDEDIYQVSLSSSNAKAHVFPEVVSCLSFIREATLLFLNHYNTVSHFNIAKGWIEEETRQLQLKQPSRGKHCLL